MLQICLAQAAFQISPRIHAGRAVRLKKHQVAPVLAIAQTFPGLKEMVEPGLKQIGRTGVTGDMPAQLAGAARLGLVGPHHHGQRVPAHERCQPLLHGQVAGEHGLLVHCNGVEVGRTQLGLPANAVCSGQATERFEDVAGAGRAVDDVQRLKSLAPLGGFLWVRVNQALVGG